MMMSIGFIGIIMMATSLRNVDSIAGNPYMCFDPSTSVELANGKMIAVEDLQLGDEIVSCRSAETGNCANHYLDTVTDVTIIEKDGPFSAHTFVFENERQINVTSPHIMYTYEMKAGELIPVTTAAKDVRENDVMMLQGGSFSRVTKVIDIQLNRKVSINTAGGSFFANGVLTTGMVDFFMVPSVSSPNS